MRVLIVEDDPLVRHLMARVIAGRGHEIVSVTTADEALKQHARQRFPLMVLDWMLPGADGLELCRKVRALEGGEEVVILVVTARDKPADRDHALEAGASDYLAKPIEPATLQTRLVVAERAALNARKRREALAALGESEARLRTIVDAAADGILTCCRGGHIQSINAAGRHMFDLADDLAELPQLFDLLPGFEVPPAQATPGRARPVVEERRALTADGRPFPVELTVSPVEHGGRELLTLVIRNLTERKEIESKLLLADRMATVGTLTAGIAHEINNPLAYVLANISVVTDALAQSEGGLNHDQLEACLEGLRDAAEGAERVRHIVSDLKTFSRPDDRRVGPIDLQSLLESSLSMAGKEIQHRARVVRDLPPGLFAQANEARLGQVFLNLLVNAAQAIETADPDRNEIRLRSWALPPDRVAVEIADSGVGIAPENRERIFDPFFTTKPVGVGTGLGLSICHGIVTQLGGEIEIDSQLGGGTRVRVTLPAAERVPPPSTAPEEANGVRAPRAARVLVIDDEPFVGRALRRALREHEVVTVSSGEDGLRLLREDESFDVVFCDLIMPARSGMDVFAEVRQQLPALAPRFIFMTGGAYTPEARSFLANLENPWIEKPFSVSQLRELVHEELGRRAAER